MHRIDAAGATAENLFTEGNPVLGIPATEVSDDWLNDMQENVAQAIEAAGIVLEKGIYDQLADAITALAGAAIPVGTEFLWPSETPPSGFLEENGASLVRATYPGLFAAIGTMYGAADGTHFNLPDARGRFPRIWAHGQTTDPDRATRTIPAAAGATIVAGDHVGTNQADGFKSHQHVVEVGQASGGALSYIHYSSYCSYIGAVATTLVGGNETRGINTYRMMIIKAF
jgi:hypothetical protein